MGERGVAPDHIRGSPRLGGTTAVLPKKTGEGERRQEPSVESLRPPRHPGLGN